MLLEICANSYQSAINAQNAGADRIELCSELSVGGLTPSYGLLLQVVEQVTIPVHVLIRPRSGDFYYTDEEFLQMKANIELCKKLGFQGIVSGVLNADNSIDEKKTQELIALSKPLSFTFHRAFDCVIDPLKSLETLMNLGVDRILTSGQKNKALDGLGLLKQLKDIAKDKLIILPGSGINNENIGLFKQAGFTEIHTSASKNLKKNTVFFDGTNQTISDIRTIKEILNQIKNA
ncbi:copper homeostasis protein CutC [Polaribacter marinivivus]|uniref:PF03932 family protein CutC n=1 Tax=Polaribacter marinivivus TaxID=1524260 RepID=A0ABV8R8Z6_9FLAO